MISIIEMVDALVYIHKQQGWKEAFDMAGQFLREPFYERRNGYVLRKSILEPISIPKLDMDLELRQIDLKDFELLKTIMPVLRVKRIARKIQAGEICYAAIKDGEVIGYVLAGFQSTPSTRQIRLRLDPDEAYLWAGYALPPYRRQGVVKVVNLSLCKLLQERGYKKVVLLVEQANQASLGHCYKMNYHVTDQINYLRILGWVSCQITPTQISEHS